MTVEEIKIEATMMPGEDQQTRVVKIPTPDS